MTDFAELRAAIDAATPGPWTQGESAAGLSCVWVGGKSEPVRDMGPDCSWIDCNTEPNARYIAAASPDVIRALLADHDTYRRQAQHETDVAHAAFERVKALEAERDVLREALTECLRVNETDAGADVAVWANAMLVARAALAQGQGEA